MAQTIIMPKAGMAMEEGTIIKWLKAEGDIVEQGEPLLEILTDKVNMEVEAMYGGTLLKILKPEGAVVPVTQPIAYVGQPGEQVADVAAQPSKAVPAADTAVPATQATPTLADQPAVISPTGQVAATPVARATAAERKIDLHLVKPTGSSGEIKLRDVLAFKGAKASSLARKIAEVEQIDLNQVTGSGYQGKIMKQDLAGARPQHAGTSLPEDQSARPVAATPLAKAKPLAGIRKVIAERMLKSHLEIPPVTLNAKADVTELQVMREKINQSGAVKITYNDFILKAVAMALKAYPAVNASLVGQEIIEKSEINVGLAVALEDGLTVPVIKGADQLSLRELSATARELASKARKGGLTLADLSGGTFTVSNLGAYDIVSFNPIINQPEAAILGVCSIEEELKMVQGSIVVKKMMGLSLTFDHRIIDGAVGAIFLKKIKELLENPLDMLI